jgi:hypothetical protein
MDDAARRDPESALPAGLDALAEAVRTNCHISDARHAQDLTLCTYLLAMRELFRWEARIPLGEEPPRKSVGRWIAEREALWETLGDRDLVRLPVGGESFDPFDVDAINARLGGRGLVYGAGLGRFHKPHFFLGMLERRERRGAVEVQVVAREFAHDLQAYPASLQGERVYLRMESLERWLWSKAETWDHNRGDGAMGAALAAYGFAIDPHLALARMARAQGETLILHELGEHAAGSLLGHEWEDMLAASADRRAEMLARAVRDHLADCLVTLPALIERDASASIHFWFANLEGLRRELFPRLARAYDEWRSGKDLASLGSAAAAGREHWHKVALGLLEAHRHPADGASSPRWPELPALD